MPETEKENQEVLDLESALKELYVALSKETDDKFIGDFFECLFTKAELNDFAKRWLLVKEISKGTTQREIARKFHISLCKITRGSKEFKKEDSAFKKMLGLAQNSVE